MIFIATCGLYIKNPKIETCKESLKAYSELWQSTLLKNTDKFQLIN